MIYMAERDVRNMPESFSARGVKFEVTWYEDEFVVVKAGDPRVTFEDNITGGYDCFTEQEGFARLVDANEDGKRDFYYYQPCGDDQMILVFDPERNELRSEVVRPDTDRSLLGFWGREFRSFPAWMLIAGLISLGFSGFEFLKEKKKQTDKKGQTQPNQ